MSNRRALLVGVNQFQFLPNATLKGCVNDTFDFAALLKDTLHFSDDDITLLHDAQATKVNILSNLTTLVAAAKAGSVKYIVFLMSSHGTQVPDISGDEADQADEAFCPHDLQQNGDQWDTDHVIIDDELHDLFVQLPDDVLLECYFDTCHSGTGLRPIDLMGFPDRPKPRYLPPPTFTAFDRLRALPARGLADLREGTHRVAKPKRALPGINDPGSSSKTLVDTVSTESHHILWAGCRSDQTSADATFNGRPNGAFTYYYLQAIRSTQNKQPRRKVLQLVRDALKTGGYDQTVQLEADATNRNGRPPEA